MAFAEKMGNLLNKSKSTRFPRGNAAGQRTLSITLAQPIRVLTVTRQAITISEAAGSSLTIPYSRIVEVAPDGDDVRVVYREEGELKSIIIGCPAGTDLITPGKDRPAA